MIRRAISATAKEFRLLKTQKIALALVILYPIIIAGSLGLIYSGQMTQKISVGIVIGEGAMPGEGEASIDFFSELNGFENIRASRFESEPALEEAVKSGELLTGITVSREADNRPYRVKVITDNTDIVRSSIAREFVASAVYRVTTKITTQMLRGIWESFLSSEDDLKKNIQRADALLVSLEETKKATEQLDAELDNIPLGEIGSAIKAQKARLEETKKKNRRHRKKFGGILQQDEQHPNRA